MKAISATTGALAALLLLSAVAAADVNRIVLRVNDQIVTLQDYRVRYSDRVNAIRAQDLEPDRRAELLAHAGEQTLCELLEEMLIVSRADQLRLEVSDDEIAQAMEGAKQNLGIQTEAEFDAALANAGMTRQSFRKQLERSRLVQEVMARDVGPRVQVDEEDLRRYYQRHQEEFVLPRRLRLKEIVVLESGGAPLEERRQEADRIVAALRGGEDPEVAIAPLEAAGETTGVIDLGWVAPGDLDPALEAAVWDLEPGAVSEPIAARGGLHIVLLELVQDERQRPFSEVEEEIQVRERNRLLESEMESYRQELVAKAYIRDAPPPEAAGYKTGCFGDQDLPLAAPAVAPTTPAD